MNESTKTKKALRGSLFALFVCIALLIGTTFAWFTDTASTGVNKIVSGKLDVGLEVATEWDGNGAVTKWESAEGKILDFQKAAAGTGEKILWEPGCTYKLPEIRVINKGNLALKYTMKVTGVEGDQKLNEVIDWTIGDKALSDTEGNLKASGTSDAMTLQGHMQESAGNEYQNLSIEGISITVYATQYTEEYDSIDNQYDKDAGYTYSTSTVKEMNTALKNAKNGDTIKVASDLDPERAFVADNKNITLDMNGKTIANKTDVWGDSADQWSLVSAEKGSNLTIDGNGTFKAKKDDCYAVDVQDGSSVVIKNGTFVGNIHAVYVYEGTAIIEGGTFSVQQKYPQAGLEDEFVLNCYDTNRKNETAKIIVKGGTFINFNPANCKAEGAGTNFVADGYKVTSETQSNGDIWYTVVAK